MNLLQEILVHLCLLKEKWLRVPAQRLHGTLLQMSALHNLQVLGESL